MATAESGPDLFKYTKFNPKNIFFVKSGDLIWQKSTGIIAGGLFCL